MKAAHHHTFYCSESSSGVNKILSIPGVKCVLTEQLNQDPLEAFFGRRRMSCGRNDNPSVNTFLKNYSFSQPPCSHLEETAGARRDRS